MCWKPNVFSPKIQIKRLRRAPPKYHKKILVLRVFLRRLPVRIYGLLAEYRQCANWPRHNASNWYDDVLPTLLHVGVRFLVNSLLFGRHSQLPREFHFCRHHNHINVYHGINRLFFNNLSLFMNVCNSEIWV